MTIAGLITAEENARPENDRTWPWTWPGFKMNAINEQR